MQVHHAPDRMRYAGTANAIHKALMDAHQKLQNIAHIPLSEHDLHATMWVQEWPSSNCGFGREIDKNHTLSYVIVVSAPDHTPACVVWIADKHAYVVEEPTQLFFHDMQHHCLRGEGNPDRRVRYDRANYHIASSPQEPPLALAQ
jgi:hypothetical protein